MGEYVVEYIYGSLGDTIIPGDAGDADIQFSVEMEWLVMGGEFRTYNE